MKHQTVIMILLLLVLEGCKQSTTGPSSGMNLLTNSTFELNGIPSLHGWNVSDTSGMKFLTDIPPAGSGRSIAIPPMGLPPSPLGAIYQTIPAPIGVHRYLISVFGKINGWSGGVRVSLNRPFSSQWKGWFPGIGITDSTWTFYSNVDTITAVAGDTIFVIVAGGACEACPVEASTYFNTCKFEKLD